MKKIHLIIYLSLFLGMCQQMMAQTLYVDGSFTGTSDGSATAPYKTIGDALTARDLAGVSNMTSDEEIIVKGGTYTPSTTTEAGFVTATSGGFGSYWLTIRPETGETVIIDGANLFDDKFAALITVTSGATNVRIQGFKLQNQRNNPALTSVVNGVTVLDVKFGIQLGNYVTNVEIIDNEIYDFSWTSAADPMKTRTTFSAAEIATIKTATGSDNCGPISVVGTSLTPITGLVIKNNYIHNVIPGYTEGIQVNGNVDGFEISDNTITEVQNIGIVAAGHYGWVENIAGATVTSALNQARNGVIKGNNVSSCRSPIAAAAGIYCDGSLNVIVENNIASDGQVGFSIGNENIASNSGGHILRNNVSHDNVWTGFIVGVPTAGLDSYIDNVTITGNTSFRNGGITDTYLGVMGQSELIINRNIQNLTVQNNIFYTTNHANLISVSAPFSTAYQGYFATFDIDYNTYYTNTTTGNTGIFDYSQSGVVGYYGTFAFYQSQNPNGYGYDQNSQFLNPQFANTTSTILDLSLLASSPAINAGNPTFTGTGETDYLGNARVFNSIVDAGAYESTTTSTSNLTSLTVTDNATNLTITVLGNVIEPTYDTFIDIDNNAATGYSGGSILGADFYISGGTIYSYSGTAPAWGWTATTGVTVTDTSGSREFVIDRATLGLTNSGTTINVLYQNTINFVATDVLPATGMLAYTTTTGQSNSSCTASELETYWGGDTISAQGLLASGNVGEYLYLAPQSNVTTGTWSWTGPNGAISNNGNKDIEFIPLSASDSGNYTVTYQVNGCTHVATYTVSIANSSSSCTASELETYWGGDTISAQGLLASGNVGEYLYLAPQSSVTTGTWSWTGPNGAISNNGNKDIEFIPLSASDSGNYTVTYQVNGCTHVATYTVSIANNNSPTITLDGNSSEWGNISTLASNGGATLKVYDDATDIYFLVSGTLSTNSLIFLNTDNNSSGYTYSWNGGMDYYIEGSNDLYDYAGTNGAWSWTQVSGAVTGATATSVEVKVAKSSLSGLGSTISVGVSIEDANWNQVNTVPASGTAATYTLSTSSKVSASKTSVLESLKLYPNPASSTINVSGLQEGERVRVFDLIGNLITETINTKIDVSNLKSGIYVMKSDLHNSIKFIKK